MISILNISFVFHNLGYIANIIYSYILQTAVAQQTSFITFKYTYQIHPFHSYFTIQDVQQILSYLTMENAQQTRILSQLPYTKYWRIAIYQQAPSNVITCKFTRTGSKQHVASTGSIFSGNISIYLPLLFRRFGVFLIPPHFDCNKESTYYSSTLRFKRGWRLEGV